MGLANDMKKLKEDILASYQERAKEYQQRIRENEELVAEVQRTLDQFRTNHLEMAANLHASAEALHNNLKQAEADRLTAFGNLMKGIRESVSSIQAEVEDIRHSTVGLLQTFSGLRGELAKELNEKFMQARAGREKQDQDRIAAFNGLMQNIHDDLTRSKDEVRKIMTGTGDLLKKYANDHAMMSANLRNSLNTNLEERVAYTRTLLKTFHDRLTEIHQENLKMAENLRSELLQSKKDLSASDAQRMEEFDKTMGEIRQRVGDIKTFIENLLTGLSADRKQAATEWESLPEEIARIKNNIVWPSAEPETDSEESKLPVDSTKEEKTEGEKDEKPEQEKEEEKKEDSPRGSSLEEKIISFLNAHPEGVKVSEMEEPLGEQRMRIGYVCKKLVEEGKIIKLDRAYFPKLKG